MNQVTSHTHAAV